MYTLVYLNGRLNRPDTLSSFLQANIGKSPLIQIDCLTPFQGTVEALAEIVGNHLCDIDPLVEVKYKEIKNASKVDAIVQQVNFLVLQIQITNS